MGKYTEIAQTAYGFLRSAFFPVYLLDDVPQSFDPNKNIVKSNRLKNLPDKNQLTIVSWNILRNYDSQNINKSLAEIIEKCNPDILLIQEAPVNMLRNFNSFWEHKMFNNFNYYYAPLHQVKKQTKFYNFSHSGQLTFSKYFFTKTAAYQLPSVTKPILGQNHVIKRIALYTQINYKEKTTGIYNVHLENAAWQNGRKKQLEYLLQIIEQNNDDAVIIGGDFNTFLGSNIEQGLQLLEENGFNNLFKNDFRLLPRLDYFFASGCKAKGLQLKGNGSDHLPVMAEIIIE